ncbi:MAG: lyase [Gemmatimonadetes bacterium]|nr:lyase [Gemmatimonadota bacterium]
MKRWHLTPAVLLLVAASAATAQQVEIREWPVPWENTRPRDPYADAQGRVWFVGQVGNYIAFLDPASGEFKRYEIEEGTNPHNLIVDARGVWYAGNANARIGLLDPQTGKARIFPMPDPAARDPHTLVFAPDGNLWFTVQGGNFIGRLMAATGEVKVIPSKTASSRPYGIRLDASGRPWINLFNSNKIATVDPSTNEIREYEVPRPGARTRRIEVTKDGLVWYVDFAEGYLGRLDPATGQTKEWRTPSAERSRPYAMASDDHGRIWFVETGVQPNQFVGFDPKTEQFFSVTPIPSGGGAVRHMMFEPEKREIWFGTDRGTIGKAAIPR